MNENGPTRPVFPFAALTGQPLMTRALLANALCPEIGGVLLRGQKGTAKSTAVRALASLLPPVSVVRGCAWHCSPSGPLCPSCAAAAKDGPLSVAQVQTPLVTLPLSATEDRLVGSLDMESAIGRGKRRMQPGLLALAHRGMLYVDEVNLLPDHMVDLLLDVCASGVNRVERDGCAFVHASNFALIGSMNPEEGPLRPQLLDRFGLCVDVLAPQDVATRMEVLRRRTAFDADTAAFLTIWQDRQQAVAGMLVSAKALLPEVRVSETLLKDMATLCAEALCAGHRGELALLRAARALAALDGCPAVRNEHVQEAAALALVHRRRMQAPQQAEQNTAGTAQSQHAHEEHTSQPSAPGQKHSAPQEPLDGGQVEGAPQGQDNNEATAGTSGIDREEVFSAGDPYQVKALQTAADKRQRSGSGRHSRSRTAQKCGRCVGYSHRPPKGNTSPDIALEPTIMAAALRMAASMSKSASYPLQVQRQDWRYKRRERKIGNLVVFAVDASGSMGAAGRMREVKSAILSLLLHAYQKRDHVSLVVFRGQQGKVLLPPTGSVERASRELEILPTGGRTPLADGLKESFRVIGTALRKKPDTRPILIVVSDGRANVTPRLAEGSALDAALAEAGRIAQDARVHSFVIDVEQAGLLQFGQARQLAEALRAEYLPVQDLRASTLVGLVREMTA